MIKKHALAGVSKLSVPQRIIKVEKKVTKLEFQ